MVVVLRLLFDACLFVALCLLFVDDCLLLVVGRLCLMCVVALCFVFCGL